MSTDPFWQVQYLTVGPLLFPDHLVTPPPSRVIFTRFSPPPSPLNFHWSRWLITITLLIFLSAKNVHLSLWVAALWVQLLTIFYSIHLSFFLFRHPLGFPLVTPTPLLFHSGRPIKHCLSFCQPRLVYPIFAIAGGSTLTSHVCVFSPSPIWIRPVTYAHCSSVFWPSDCTSFCPHVHVSEDNFPILRLLNKSSEPETFKVLFLRHKLELFIDISTLSK